MAWSLVRTYQAVLLCEAASKDPGNRRLATAARVFSRQPLIVDDEAEPASLSDLAYGENR
jgi:hypothetical protein